MGKFKEEHGKSRVGLFLKDVAPQILEKVGDLTGVPGLTMLGNLIAGSSDLDQDQKTKALEMLQIDLQFEQELTARHKTDMTSDSLLSKNIRPVTLIYMIILLTGMILANYGGYAVDEEYIDLVKTLLISVFLFYFGGREVQKALINWKTNSKKS